jgi:dTDP-4-dehydrorhamnose reductase
MSHAVEWAPDIIIHTAAMTRPMIDHELFPRDSIEANIIGTANMARIADMFYCRLVYISTDYVYPGQSGSYKETDAVDPVNNYAMSKLGGECSVRMLPNSLVIRTAFTESPFPHDKAFFDLYKSYLYVDEVAPKIWDLALSNTTGIINVGGKKQSTLDFAKQRTPDIEGISRATIDEKTPQDTSLDINKLEKFYSDKSI